METYSLDRILGSDFCINDDHLIMLGTRLLYFERIPDRPWWQRLWSYLVATFCSPDNDPEKIVLKQTWTKWEITECHSEIYSSTNFEKNDMKAKETGKKFIGKTLTLHPKYIVFDNVQYNKPHYFRTKPSNICSHVCSYKFGIKGIDDIADYSYLFHNNGDIFLIFCLNLDGMKVNFNCQRLPDPSLWERIKYYFNYLFDIDASRKGLLGMTK